MYIDFIEHDKSTLIFEDETFRPGPSFRVGIANAQMVKYSSSDFLFFGGN